MQSIQNIIIDEKSKCFITDQDGNKYKIIYTNKNEDVLAFLKTEDKVYIKYVPDSDVNVIKDIKK